MNSLPGTNSIKGTFALTFLVYVSIKFLIFYNYPVSYIPIADAAEYVNYSRLSIFSPAFYLDRPFLYPLLIKLFAQHQLTILFLQCLISTLSWIVLASFFYEKWVKTRERVGLVCFYFTLIFSLSLGINQWNNLMLTESLSISCIAIWVFLFFKNIENNFSNFKEKCFFIVVSIALFNLRDGNAYFLMMISPFFLYYAWKTKGVKVKRFCLAVLVCYFTCFSFSIWTSNKGGRWWISMGNTLSYRLASQFPQAIDYFVEKGMPLSGKIFLDNNKNTINGRNLFYGKGDLPEWMQTHSKNVYIKYFLTHPRYLLSPLFFDEIFFSHGFDPPSLYTDWYGKPHFKGVNYFLGLMNNTLFAVTHFWVIFLLLGILLSKKMRAYLPLQICSFLLGASLLSALFIWLADALEEKRHLVIVYEMIWIIFIFVIFNFYSKRIYLPLAIEDAKSEPVSYLEV